jgi:thiosulfate/3-mercaptopyruvate sulfurtransferase
MKPSLPSLVSTEWLASRLGSPGLRAVDGSWYLPGSGRDAAAEYRAGHIPGAVFFDLDATSDPGTSLPHMLPREDEFAARMQALGLSDGDNIVVYDGSGVNLSAPRVWWTFRTFGHLEVAVLDGGSLKWRREGRPLEQGSVRLPQGRFTARLDGAAVRDLPAVLANIVEPKEQLVDLRPAGRFAGTDPEPRPNVRGGHIPGSLNFPFTELAQADGTMLPPDELRRRLAERGIDLSKPVIATCGSGTSACALILALDLLGHQHAAVYDGAWTEWGGRSDTPVTSSSKSRDPV